MGSSRILGFSGWSIHSRLSILLGEAIGVIIGYSGYSSLAQKSKSIPVSFLRNIRTHFRGLGAHGPFVRCILYVAVRSVCVP